MFRSGLLRVGAKMFEQCSGGAGMTLPAWLLGVRQTIRCRVVHKVLQACT